MPAAGSPTALEAKKPAVVIALARPVPEEILSPVLRGLEEEGIPAELREVESDEAASLAKRGADDSPLNVGIGIHGGHREVALHHRDLPAARPLFVLTAADLVDTKLRLLGANAARLVKGEPLVFDHGDRDADGEQRRDRTSTARPVVREQRAFQEETVSREGMLSREKSVSPEDMEQLVQLVTRIVIELLQPQNP